jgi:3-oxoacyl-[acyl-carrier-protein] synthase II
VRGYDPTAPIGGPVYPRGPGIGSRDGGAFAQGRAQVGALQPLGPRRRPRGLHRLRARFRPGLPIPSERIGVNLGVGLGGLPEIVATHETWRLGGFRKISPFFILQAAPNILAGQLAILLNCRGPNMSIASACATSGHTLGESARAIRGATPTS